MTAQRTRSIALAWAAISICQAGPAYAQDNGGQDNDDSAAQNEADASHNSSAAPSMLVILAHPDDEVLVMPALARVARTGGKVTIAFATSGDQGAGLSGVEKGPELARLRQSEARCSAFALGADAPQFWKLGDGSLAKDAHTSTSAARTLITHVDKAIKQTRPKVVITFGPDGASGHSDHRMVSAATTQVIQAIGADRPDLLYIALPSNGTPALPGFESWARVDPALITDRIEYQNIDLDAAQAAIECYESQFDQAMRDQLIDALNQTVWRGRVHLRLAFPPPF